MLLALLAASPVLASVEIPEPLREWQEWVLRDLPEHRCPMLRPQHAPSSAAWICAWPHRLQVDIDARGAAFAGAVTMYGEGWLSLPGSRSQWPEGVSVDARPVPVTERDGAPAIRLAVGVHRIEGRINWVQRPAKLVLPEVWSWLDLRVDGKPGFDLPRDASGVALGAPVEPPVMAAPDALQVDVFRRLSDGVPMQLETRIRLVVSGSTRELALGRVLPEGVEAWYVHSPLPVGLHAERGLYVLLRPGTHWVTLGARALEPLPELAAVTLEAPWPDSEVWSYQADSALRLLDVSARMSLDPNQEDIPGEWRRLPAWRLAAGEPLLMEARTRGLADASARRLNLNRNAWLDFDGGGLHMRDQLSGSIGSSARLQMHPSWRLLRAELDGRPMPISHSGGAHGLELRSANINLAATSRVNSSLSLPVSGWQESLDRVDIRLHLPPGYLLISAAGAERANDTWLARWNLLDLFVVLLAAMLVGRLLGRLKGGLALLLFVLTYPEYPVLLFALTALVMLQLLRDAVRPALRLAAFVGFLRNVAVLVLVLVALPFVAAQLRLALHPQLELPTVQSSAHGVRLGATLAGKTFGADAAVATPEVRISPQYPRSRPPAAPAPVARATTSTTMEAEATLDRIEVSGSRIKTPDLLDELPVSHRALAGLGEPDWGWRVHHLSWNGPVLAEQTVRLLILPRWLGRVLRVLSVALLALLLVKGLQHLRLPPGTAPPLAAAAMLLLFVGMASPPTLQAANASTIPDSTQLQALRAWLLRTPDCAPRCVEIGEAGLLLDEDGLQLIMQVHVADDAGLALPQAHPGWMLQQITVNGVVERALHGDAGHAWLWLPGGVHRVELRAGLGDAVSLSLRFQNRPNKITAQVPDDWQLSGIRDQRMQSSQLELRRRVPDTEAPESEQEQRPTLSQQGLDAKPFYEVRRTLALHNEWRLQTTVARQAPEDGLSHLELPLWPGENPLDERLEIRDGNLQLRFTDDNSAFSWESRLDTERRLEITAGSLDVQSETWRVGSSGHWRFRAEGVPVSELEQSGAIQTFRPLPGETLVLEIDPVEAIDGPWLAIDDVQVNIGLAQRATDYAVSARLRATQAGQHAVRLPDDIEVLDVRLDNISINARPEQGVLRVPLAPGNQLLTITWRESTGARLHWRSRMPDLGVSSANIKLALQLPTERWVLQTRGPLLGPAVLYWGELLVMLLIAAALTRSGRTPLRFWQWLLLGLGFSTLSWTALVVVVLWLLAVDWRQRHGAGLTRVNRNLLQIGLVLFTAVAVLVLISIIPAGLLGRPDMHLTGNGSTPTLLRWFADRSDGPLPDVAIYSLPMWAYRLVILLWAVWLAAALIAWLRWTWQAMSVGGYWESAPARSVPDTAKTSPEAKPDSEQPAAAPPQDPADDDAQKQ